MISTRRMAVGELVMVGSGLSVGIVAGSLVGNALLVGRPVGAWVGALGVSKALHPARKRPPAAAPSPRAARRRNSLRVSLVMRLCHLVQPKVHFLCFPMFGTEFAHFMLLSPGRNSII